ncbi:MAG: DUF892 family protein [Thermoleophilaceae bacterium]|nr:DUF892 family protein [Thermoleophilaceae bacterium]
MAKQVTASDAKLIQYLNEAYGKEKQLETALQAHILMAKPRKPYEKKLKEHLRETKRHATEVKKRIRALGGTAEEVDVPGPDAIVDAATTVQSAGRKAVELLRGQAHVVRGTGEAEKMLKNAKTEYSNEAEEIANYKAIEQLAETVGDKETLKVARAIRREEERMASFLERLIPQLVKAVAQDEIPASERGTAGARGRSAAARAAGGNSSSSSSHSGSKSRSGSGRRSSSTRKPASRSRAKSTSPRSTSSRARSSSSRSRRKG